MHPHIFELREKAFVLWRPRATDVSPRLVIGHFLPGNPPTLEQRQTFELTREEGQTDLWSISTVACGLRDGEVYHYWFELNDSSPFGDGRRILCTDPMAYTVDWRLGADVLPAPYGEEDQDPAAVVKFEDGLLVACDPAGEPLVPARPLAPGEGQPNNRIVIYELPTSWTNTNVHGDPQIRVGTFRDVLALVSVQAATPAPRACRTP
jgi:pullulanase